jgi:hypothetical protein
LITRCLEGGEGAVFSSELPSYVRSVTEAIVWNLEELMGLKCEK